jgi:hypothetical protein
MALRELPKRILKIIKQHNIVAILKSAKTKNTIALATPECYCSRPPWPACMSFFSLSTDQPTIKSPLTRHAPERFGKILHDATKYFYMSDFFREKTVPIYQIALLVVFGMATLWLGYQLDKKNRQKELSAKKTKRNPGLLRLLADIPDIRLRRPQGRLISNDFGADIENSSSSN